MWSLLLLLCFHLIRAQLLIKNGTVVNSDRQFLADVLVEDGLIVRIDRDIQEWPEVKVIDASGLYVMPGGIDPHTHMEMNFMGHIACDDFFSGQAAALAGGITMHIDFAQPVDGDLERGYLKYLEKSKKGCMDFGFHMVVNRWNDQVSILVSKSMARLVENGINSFKFFMAYKGFLMVSDDDLLEGFQRCRELGAIPMVHAENGEAVVFGQNRVFNSGITVPKGHALSRPIAVEAEATSRAIRFAELVDVPLYVVHVTSKESLSEVYGAHALDTVRKLADQVSRAKRKGRRVVGEALTVGISMNGDKINDPDFKVAAQYVMSPPIRYDADKAALKKALVGGSLDLIGTDHAVFNSTQKATGRNDFRLIPNGVNGIEEMMHVTWNEMVNSGLVSPMEFVRLTSTKAAQIFNIYPQKGVIAVGSDADIIVLDPNQKHVISARKHHSRMDTNIYEGKEVTGKVAVTVSRGRVVWVDGRLDVKEETGRFIPMKPFSPYLYPTSDFASTTSSPDKTMETKDEL